jgi:PAS domain S-box-containing protein
VIIFNLTGILIVPLFGDVTFYATTPAFYFTVVIALLILIAAVWRSRSMLLLERQSRELSESEARYRSLIEASFETVVVHREGMIVNVNPAVERLIGYKPEEIIGRQTMEFVDPISHPIIRAIAQTNSEAPYEAVLRHKNGTLLHAELRGKTQWYDGEMVRFVTVRDITEQKREEDLIVEREKVRVLQNFIGDLSHDLRTPLSVINTSIYLIERLAKEPKRQQHHIDVLQEQAKHMQRLLEDLISMARLDKADTGDFRYQWGSVNEPVAQAVQDQQNLALRKSQTLAHRLGSDLPNVLIDAEQLKLALKHLILNGLSYTGKDGTVMVETLTRDGYVIVQVRDTGVGIAPEDMPHIFEQFYRADRARGEEGGTGVGLSIAKKIVEAHNGRIEAESIPGHGSIFRILLPIAPG